jgi:transcriptional antiterminator RfaH
MAYWACAQLDHHRERLALHCLGLAGYEIYAPRISTGRKSTALLFPSYVFVQIIAGWWHARWSAGVIRLIQNGSEPTHVPERIITDLRARERNGLVVLPAKLGLQRGDQVRIVRGPLVDRLAIFDGMKGSERAAVLLTMLGSEQRVELSRCDIARLTG